MIWFHFWAHYWNCVFAAPEARPTATIISLAEYSMKGRRK